MAARIERETGIPVNIIDGDQEAAFVAGGVAQAWPERSEPRLIAWTSAAAPGSFY